MSQSIVFRLSALGVLRIDGTDADSFLQGQLSSDLRKLTPAQGQIASYNSPKGRMLAVLQLARAGDAVLAEVHTSVLAPTLQRLRMFVLRSKVRVEDASAELPAIGLAGDDAAARLAAAGLALPDDRPCATAASGALLVMRRHGRVPRYSLRGPAAEIEALLPRLGTPVEADAASHWQRLELEAGMPTVYPATRDALIAPMCNLDRLGGIAYDKGCYTGQEIIARLHYLGTLKRRMFLCRGTGAPPAPGTPVHADQEAQAVGDVVDSVPLADGGCLALVVLQLSHAEAPALRAGEALLGMPLALA